MAYRSSRNYEESIRYFLDTEKTGVWNGLTVCKGFQQAYDIKIPVLAVQANITNHTSIEVGSKSTTRKVQIFLHIFAENDGQRLDLKDWVVETIKSGCIYYNCSVTSDLINRVANGLIEVLSITDEPIDFGKGKDVLDKRDKYRHKIVITVSNSQVES